LDTRTRAAGILPAQPIAALPFSEQLLQALDDFWPSCEPVLALPGVSLHIEQEDARDRAIDEAGEPFSLIRDFGGNVAASAAEGDAEGRGDPSHEQYRAGRPSIQDCLLDGRPGIIAGPCQNA
jgi:hypothetical protein